MLSPEDWGGQPPKPFRGSYRLENDMSWTPAEAIDQPDESAQLLGRLVGSSDSIAGQAELDDECRAQPDLRGSS
jgi:hypothetical protein